MAILMAIYYLVLLYMNYCTPYVQSENTVGHSATMLTCIHGKPMPNMSPEFLSI